VVLVLLAGSVGCDLHVDVGRVQEALEGRGARGDGVDGGVGFGEERGGTGAPGGVDFGAGGVEDDGGGEEGGAGGVSRGLREGEGGRT
jgi:hypothetical protein